MYWVIVIMMLFILPFVFKKLSAFCFKVEESIQQKEKRQEEYMAQLIDSSKRIEESLNPPQQPKDYVQALLDANKEIMEKNKFNRALEEELGIPMD